jgi:hypothetical protein
LISKIKSYFFAILIQSNAKFNFINYYKTMSFTSLVSSTSTHAAAGGGGGAAAQAAAPSDHKTSAIFKAAQVALRETLSHGILTMQKIIPCTELYGSSLEDIEMNYARHGSRLLEVIDHTTKTNFLRSRLVEKMEELDIRTAQAFAAFALAVKKGACQELTIICSQSPSIAPFHRYNYHLKGALINDGSTNDHSLIVISETPLPLERKGEDFISFIARSSDACVIDPYLEKVVHSKDILKDEEFALQLTAMRNTSIAASMQINPKLSLSLDDPKLVALSTYLRSLDAESVEPPASVSSFLYAKRKQRVLSALHRDMPELTWKISPRHEVWARGSLELLTAKKDLLAAKGLEARVAKIEGKEEYCIIFSFRNYKELRQFDHNLHA